MFVTKTSMAKTEILRQFAFRYWLLFLLAALAAAPSAQGQFLVLAQDEDTVEELRNGSTLTFASEGVGDSVTIQVSVAYQGPDRSTATIGVPDLAGSRTFALSGGPQLPGALAPGRTIEFDVTFTPTGVGPFSSRLTLNLTQNELGKQPVPMNVVLNLSGVVADYTVSFQLLGEGNETLVGDGGVFEFPETELEQTSTATVILTNRGSGPGTVRDIVFTGENVFVVSGIPLLPAEILAGRDLRFRLEFTPLERRRSSASMNVTFGLGSQAITILGPGVGAIFAHESIIDGVVTAIPEGGKIILPRTELDEETSITVRVRNTGNFEGDVSTITVNGDGYSLSDTPILPATLDLGDEITFTITFAPTEPGLNAGQLRVNDITFDLEGEALGAQIIYTTISGSITTTVEPPEALVFPQTRIGRVSPIIFEITNSGNVAKTITGIGVSGSSFSLQGLPPLPASLGPDQKLAFTINFAPTNTGPLNGSITVDAASFSLSGVGEELEDLSAVNIGGSGGAVGPAQQISTSLTLAEPFPVDLKGTLSLSFTSEVFSNDPAVQFSTGGRTVSFTIPANQVAAEFATGTQDILLQTGTVAGTITLSPSFQSKIGGFDVTPDPAPELAFTVARNAPELRSLQITNLNDAGFAIQVTGFATSRSVNQLSFQFSGPPGSDLTTSSINANVETPFRSWYQGGQSSGFGSQFTATISFNVDGDVSSIDSVSVTATNEVGVSSPVSITLE